MTTVDAMAPSAGSKLERTYAVLRDRIHDGTYAPLTRLNMDALAREFGVSQMPVREALRRLEADGWVQFKRNAGAVVAPVEATTWEPVMACLAVLEGAASAQAVPCLRKSDMVKLRSTAAQLEVLSVKKDPFEFSRLNRVLHETVVSRCPNRCLVEVIDQVSIRLACIRQTMFVYLPERSEESLIEHRQLLSFLESGDAERVEA